MRGSSWPWQSRGFTGSAQEQRAAGALPFLHPLGKREVLCLCHPSSLPSPAQPLCPSPILVSIFSVNSILFYLAKEGFPPSEPEKISANINTQFSFFIDKPVFPSSALPAPRGGISPFRR